MQVAAAAKHSSKRAPALTYPVLSLYCWVERSLYFGSMLVHLGTMLVFLLCFWLSCFGSRCLRGCCELVDVIGPSLLGLSWCMLRMLRRLGVYVGASWDYVFGFVGLCWPILGLCWAFLGSMLGRLGSILGPSWDYVGFCWVVLGLCWPSLGLCWAFLGSMLGHLGSVLAYLGACCAMQQLDSL